MEGDMTRIFPWGIIGFSNKTITSHCAVMNNITWNNAYSSNPGICGRMRKAFLCMTNEQQSSRADIRNSLFFSTSVISPETGSENTTFFTSRCVNLGSNSTIWSNMKTERAEFSAISTCKPKISKYLNCLVRQLHPKFQILISSSAFNKLSSTSTWYHPQTRKDEDKTAVNNIERIFPNSQQEYSKSSLLNSIWIACSK